MLIVIIRGFRVSTRTLDSWFSSWGAPITDGLAPLEPPEGEPYQSRSLAQVSLLRSRLAELGGDPNADVKFFLPSGEGRDISQEAYIAYCSLFVDLSVRIEPSNLPETVPAGFEALREEIVDDGDEEFAGVEGEIGMYCVSSHERYWEPKES